MYEQQKHTEGNTGEVNKLLLRSALTTETSVIEIPWKENIFPPVSDKQRGEVG